MDVGLVIGKGGLGIFRIKGESFKTKRNVKHVTSRVFYKMATESYKVIVTGPKYSGKSTLIYRLLNNDTFSEAEAEEHAKKSKKECHEKVFIAHGKQVSLDIWDDMKPSVPVSTMYSDKLGAIFVCDGTDYQSLDELGICEAEKRGRFEHYGVNREISVFFLAFSKVESGSRQSGLVKSIQNRSNSPFPYEFFEVDSITGNGVQEMFQAMAERLAKDQPGRRSTRYNAVEDSGTGGVNLQVSQGNVPQKKGGCCS